MPVHFGLVQRGLQSRFGPRAEKLISFDI